MVTNGWLSDTKLLGVLFFVHALLAFAAAVAAADLKAVEQDGTVTIKDGDSVLLAYQSAPNPFKTYVSQWYTPAGSQVLRDSPPDHIHHHGLMYAIGAEDVDFWGEHAKYNPGKQIPRGDDSVRVAEEGELSHATIRQTIDWINKEGDRLLLETRTIVLHRGAVPGASLLTWDSTFEVAEGRDSTKLWGRDYFGLGARFVTSMDKVGTFVYPADAVDESGADKTHALRRSDWCAYTAPVDNKPVTIAMFDHPKNARHPATWFTMTTSFAYLSATLGLATEPITLTAGQSLRVRYGVALWDGKIAPEQIARAYQAWTGLHGR